MNLFDGKDNFAISFEGETLCLPVTVNSYPEISTSFQELNNFNHQTFYRVSPFTFFVHKRHLEIESNPLSHWMGQSYRDSEAVWNLKKELRFENVEMNFLGVIVEMVTMRTELKFHGCLLTSISFQEDEEMVELTIQPDYFDFNMVYK
jgi:hypothetical protein